VFFERSPRSTPLKTLVDVGWATCGWASGATLSGGEGSA